MGGKRASARQYIYVYVALLTCFTISNCALLKESSLQDESRQHLVQGEKFIAQSDFDLALTENERVLLLSADKPPSDEALFNIGLIYAHPENSKRNSAESIAFFQRLIRDYPQSPWTGKAKTWVEVIRECERSKHSLTEAIQAKKEVVSENERLKKALTAAADENERSKQALAVAAQESARLKNMIDEWKKIDRELEEKKKGRAR
jgi:outer membrane protein assembly factor BamD (BamD/ComL family)